MKKLALLLFMSLPLTALAESNASDLSTQCSKTGKGTELISDATIDRYISSVIFQGGVTNANANMRIDGTYYVTLLSGHDSWEGYPGDGVDIAKVGFTAYTLGKKVTACVNKSTGFLYGLAF